MYNGDINKLSLKNMDETRYTETRIYVASNGFYIMFSDYMGVPVQAHKTNFIAKDLDEVKKILEKKLVK